LLRAGGGTSPPACPRRARSSSLSSLDRRPPWPTCSTPCARLRPRTSNPSGKGGSFADELAGLDATTRQRRLRDPRPVRRRYFLYHENERGPGTLMDELPEALRRGGPARQLPAGCPGRRARATRCFQGAHPETCSGTRCDLTGSIGSPHGQRSRVPLERYNELVPEEEEAVVCEARARRGPCCTKWRSDGVDLGQSGRGGVGEEDADRIEASLPPARARAAVGGRDRCRVAAPSPRHSHAVGRRCAHRRRPPRGGPWRNSPPRRKGRRRRRCTTTSSPRRGQRSPTMRAILAGYAAVDEAETERVLNRLVEERIVAGG